MARGRLRGGGGAPQVPQAHIRHEASVAKCAGLSGVVVHLPTAKVGESAEATIARTAAVVPLLLDADSAPVYFEMPASGRPAFGTPAQLKLFIDKLAATLPPPLMERVGLCVDTAHLWSCGQDVADPAAMAEWLRNFEPVAEALRDARRQGRDARSCRVLFHLNDSELALDSKKDKHAGLGAGQIWPKDSPHATDSLKLIIDFASERGIPIILERTDKDGPTQIKSILSDFALIGGLLPAACL